MGIGDRRRRRPEHGGDSDSGRRHQQPWLTDTELRLLAVLEDTIDELEHAPTESELRQRLGWRSRSAVHEYLDRLRQKRVIEGHGRSLRVLK